MANQIIIDIGAAANDGTGDPLRTAFNYVNNNFSNVWNTGLPNSNVLFSGNRILTSNTNGNLILAPNGTGKVVANVDIQPNANNTLNLGSLSRQWNTVYARNVELTGNLTVADLNVGGNLTVTGNIIEMGNIVTDTKTIQLANTANSTASANLSGITVGANDDIATFLYNATANAWTVNIGVSAVGNVTAPYFIGNGSQLTGMYGNVNVAAFLANLGSNSISTTGTVTTGNITLTAANIQLAAGTSNTSIYLAPSGNTSNAYIRVPDNTSSLATGLAIVNRYGHVEVQAKDGAAVQTWYFREDGSLELPGTVAAHIKSDQDILIQTGSGDHWTFGGDNTLTTPGNLNPDTSNAYSLGNTTNQWSDLWVSNATIYMNSVPISLTSGNVLTVDGDEVVTNVNGVANVGNLNITGASVSLVNGTPETQIDISPDGPVSSWAYLQVPNNATANAYDTRLHNDAGNVEIGAGQFSTSGPNYTWLFTNTGNLALPTDGSIVVDGGDGTIGPVGDDLVVAWDNEELILRSIGGSVELQADNEVRVQSGYSVGLADYQYKWSFSNNNELVNITGDSAIVTEAGNLAISGGRDGLSSGNVTVRAVDVGVAVQNWTFDNAGTLTFPASPTNIYGGLDNDFTIATANSNAATYYFTFTQFGSLTVPVDINVSGNVNASDIVGTANGNVTVTADAQSWLFDTAGNLAAPGNVSAVGNVSGDAGVFNDVQVTNVTTNKLLYSTDDRLIYDTAFSYDSGNNIISGSGTISTTGNISAAYFIGNGSQLTGLPAQYGDSNVATFLASYGSNTISTTGNIEAGNFVGAGSNVDIVAGSYDWAFGNDGNLTLPGNTFAVKYANGTAVTLGSNYGDSNVATLLGTFGSNNISTTGNITAANFVGNISITGNVTGTQSNVTLVAGSYTWTFDNTGNTQGNLSLTGSSITINNAPGGNEGAEVIWALPSAANTSLNTSVVQDVYQNGMRFFESGGSSRGFYMDMANAPAGSGTAIGYREIPQITLSANVTADATNSGRHFYSTTAGNLQITLPDNSSVAFPTGATLTVVVNAAGNVLVTQGTGVTLYMAGSSTTGNRVVGAYGLASVMKVAANTWVISGTGVY